MQVISLLTPMLGPIIALAMFAYFKKIREDAFRSLMIRAFITGIISALILAAFAGIAWWAGISEIRSLKRTLFFSAVTVAGSAELGKFIAFRYFVLNGNQTISPVNSILLSIFTALGYSTMSLTLFSTDSFGMSSALPATLFSLLYIPANLLFSVIMGFFTGMARYLKTHVVYSLTGLFGAWIFHGIFIFCLVTRDYKLLSLFAFGSTVIVLILALKAAFTPREPL